MKRPRPGPLGAALYMHFIVEGYLWDWMTAGVLVLVHHLVPISTIDPVDRFYRQDDRTLAYPYKPNTVPSWALYLLVFLLPLVVITAGAALIQSVVDWHIGLLCIAEAFAWTSGFKRWINLVGRYRPDMLAVLQLAGSTGADTTDVKDPDVRLSYPSGHSAYMFASMSVLTWYLVGKLRLMSHPTQLLFLKASLVLVPLVLAAFVAISRIADYKHDPSDVNAGCFIGFLCGSFCYFLNYHSPFSEDCCRPRRRDVPVLVRAGSGSAGYTGPDSGDHPAGRL